MTDDDKELWWIDHAAEPEYGMQVGGMMLANVHPATACEGRGCAIHHPSDHHMKDWTLNWRGDRGLMERLCPEHGIGHPDPDHIAHIQRTQGEIAAHNESVHGCCGCCYSPRE